ncbi:Hypothetical predicted protein [Mytilus galloprovincialis]|uniref:Uncharacterized protein n=1 Tax=Mytilus galloprovincialis TaxID=29158 RepID=A0A8B6GUT9_MYTGA|nr:Hypothetical predicted protein [Mytilus galloprovincialis]
MVKRRLAFNNTNMAVIELETVTPMTDFQEKLTELASFICIAEYHVIDLATPTSSHYLREFEEYASLNFVNFKTECTSLPVHHAKYVPVEILNSSIKKRPRSCLTPMKSGCTLKRKKLVTPSTPKANRRRLNFSNSPRKTPNSTRKKVSASPGPRVKVQLRFRGSTRNTVLKGHSKLACRALVSKQYKTSLNHLLQIEELKKDLNQVIKKKISPEIQTIFQIQRLCLTDKKHKTIVMENCLQTAVKYMSSDNGFPSYSCGSK